MYTKADLVENIRNIGILPTDTLLIHSSMKAIGAVENGADTVLDAFMDYMKEGLLIFPTHTWSMIGEESPIYHPKTESVCVGILPTLFLKREGVMRSLHPTHSVAAIGKDAISYLQGEEFTSSPCPRNGCWGKLYDRKAKILFLGCSLNSNTFLHGVEEWHTIPDRLDSHVQFLQVELSDGTLFDCPQHRHHSSTGDVSSRYGKMKPIFLANKVATEGFIGDAASVLCDCVGMADIVGQYLEKNPNLFADATAI